MAETEYQHVPRTESEMLKLLNDLETPLEGNVHRDIVGQLFDLILRSMIDAGYTDVQVEIAKGRFKDLASRLDASDADMRNISVNWINKNLGKLDQTYMTEEFLQQMAGDAPINAVPADGSIVTSKLADRSILTQKLADGAVIPSKTNFVEKAETKKDIYETIKLSDYQNTGNIGKMLDENGVAVQNQWTGDLTFTNHIPIEGGAEYAMTYRNCVVFDAGNNVIDFLDNSGYTSALESKRFHGLPDDATHIAITLGKDRVATDTIERVSPLGGSNSIKVKNVRISASDTTFAKYGDATERDYYESIKISNYTNSKNDGKVLDHNAIPVSSQYTTTFTYTNIIPIVAGATYAMYFRNLVVFNANGDVVSFVDDSGYHPSLFVKQEYTMPTNASHIVINLDINRATLDTFERVSPLESDKTIVIDNLQVSPSQTDFAYFPTEDGTVYEIIKVAPYKNSSNDGKVLSKTGVIEETVYTPDLTYTEKIPVLSGGLYYVDSRSFVVFNEDQQIIGYFDNPGYSAVNSLKKEYRLPNNSKFVVLNVAIEKVDTITMERLSPNEDETPIKIKNLKVPKVDLKGKGILILGDSLNASYANNISEFIQKLTGGTVFNGALGGARLSTKTGNSENAPTGSEVVKSLISGDFQVLEDHINATRTGDLLIKQLATLEVLKTVNLSEIDVVILAFGTNDRLESVPIGNDTDDETKFKGALKLSIQRLQSANPQLKVMLASQPYSYRHISGGAYYDENTPNLAGHVIADYVKAMEEVANKYHVHFLDNYTFAGINDFNKNFYFNTNDGIHGKQESFIPLLAERYVNKLSEIY